MGQLEQFAKQVFEEETATLTGGALAWQGPVELGLSEVRLDGLLIVTEPSRLASLPAPWSLAGVSDEVVLELKLAGDHLDALVVERALLRRQARQVVRLEAAGALALPGPLPLWVVAPHRPRWLDAGQALGPGCYRLGHAPFTFLWVAANELPLCDELVPFLVARSGSALDEFGRWVAGRRPGPWLLRMLQFLPMSTAAQDEILRAVPPTDEPEVRARRRRIVQAMLEIDPEAVQPLVQQGLERGLEQGLERGLEQGRAEGEARGLGPLHRQFARRLGRALTAAEAAELGRRLGALGPERLGDVVLDLAPAALGAWLADPHAR